VNGKKCKYCSEPTVAILDGDALCQKHADEWVKAEAHTPYKKGDTNHAE